MSMRTRQAMLDAALRQYFQDMTIIEDWSLHPLAESPRSNVQDYHLILPQVCCIFHIDVPYMEDGVMIEPGPVYGDMTIPARQDAFLEQFNAYFKEYAWNDGNRERSAMTLLRTDISHETPTFLLHVVYFKHYFPFPVILTVEEELREKIADNEAKMREIHTLMVNLERQVDGMCDEICDIKTKSNHQHQRLASRIREMYGQLGKEEECPVCYETIDAKSLFIGPCAHSLCGRCADLCTSCPLCRETFRVFV